MEEKFKDIIEKIKEDTMDHNTTKKYILAIKRVFRKAFENCKDEMTESEILEECLEEYEKDLEFRGNADKIYYNMLVNNTYKRILVDYKGNKYAFDQVMKAAKSREDENRTEELTTSLNPRESMISAIRHEMRRGNTQKEKLLINNITESRGKIASDLKDDMIRVIQECTAYLEEYGIIDKYIEESNTELEQLGLENMKFLKRNPIADEYYENGKQVEHIEDIGVIDTFEEENLEKMSLGDLETMTAFWESKYLQERLELSKAMSTIKTLDLWNTIFHEDDSAIENLDNNAIDNALRKDLALTYLSKNGVKITPKIRRQYKKFLKENNMRSDVELDDEVEAMSPDISNLSAAAKDVAILECLIIYQLQEKDIKIKKWGVIEEGEKIVVNQGEEKTVTIAIENPNFRGPLIMEIPERLLRTFLAKEDLDFPEYTQELDETYCSIMSKLYMPSNKFFRTAAKKTFDENPSNKLVANLAGKKVKEER